MPEFRTRSLRSDGGCDEDCVNVLAKLFWRSRASSGGLSRLEARFEHREREEPRVMPIAESDVVRVVANGPHRFDLHRPRLGSADDRKHFGFGGSSRLGSLFFATGGTGASFAKLDRRPKRLRLVIPLDHDRALRVS